MTQKGRFPVSFLEKKRTVSQSVSFLFVSLYCSNLKLFL